MKRRGKKKKKTRENFHIDDRAREILSTSYNKHILRIVHNRDIHYSFENEKPSMWNRSKFTQSHAHKLTMHCTLYLSLYILPVVYSCTPVYSFHCVPHEYTVYMGCAHIYSLTSSIHSPQRSVERMRL